MPEKVAMCMMVGWKNKEYRGTGVLVLQMNEILAEKYFRLKP